MSPAPLHTLAPRPFIIAALAIYLASFLSQMLLSPPVAMRFGLWPFTLVQVGLIGSWYSVHAQRLRDAGHGSGLALGIAAIYALTMTLLIFVMALMIAGDGGEQAYGGQGTMQLFAVMFFFAMLFGEFGGAGGAGYWVLAFLVLVLTPFFVALVFSYWTATRPSVAASP
jgi:uncharacterized membrane protein YhaH (DUF805 family)